MIDIVNEKLASSPVLMAPGWKCRIRRLGVITYSRGNIPSENLGRGVKTKGKGTKTSVREDYTKILKHDRSYSAPANSGCGDADLVEHASNKVGHLWLIISLG